MVAKGAAHCGSGCTLGDLSVGQGILQAVKADTLSLSAWQDADRFRSIWPNDWGAVLLPDASLVELLFRATTIYLFLYLLLRFAGRRVLDLLTRAESLEKLRENRVTRIDRVCRAFREADGSFSIIAR